MSEAKDLLNSLSETEYASYSKVTPINDVLLIDAESRTINVPSTEILFGVETDKDVERKYFKCPRIVGDNVDLSTLSLRVHYQNANGEKDKYIIEDVKVVGSYITFSWLLSAKVLRYKGNIQFTVVAVSVNQDGTLNKEWNTTLASGTALEGLEVEDLNYDEEEQARDVLAQLLQLLDTRTDESVVKVQSEASTQMTNIENKGAEVLATIPQEYQDTVDNVKQNTNDIYNLQRTKASAIVGEVVGETIYVNDAAEQPPVELSLFGRTEQSNYTNGYQLFDASKLVAKSIGGASVTNNGDGSFTLSGSNTLTDVFAHSVAYTHEETIKLLKVGTLTCNFGATSYPNMYIQLIVDGNIIATPTNRVDSIGTAEVTQEFLDNETSYLRVGFYGTTGESIMPNTMKPMLYQDGDGTWERFSGGKPGPNPEYKFELENIENPNLVKLGKNLLRDSKIPDKTTLKGYTSEYEGDGVFHIYGTFDTTAADGGLQLSTTYLNIPTKPDEKYTLSAQLLEGSVPFKFHPYLGIGSDIVNVKNWFALWLYPTTKVGSVVSDTFRADSALSDANKIVRFWIYAYNDSMEAITCDFRIKVWFEKGNSNTSYTVSEENEIELPYTLRGIDITDRDCSNRANYIDSNGRLYYGDIIDLERGILHRCLKELVLDGSRSYHINTYMNNNYGRYVYGTYISDLSNKYYTAPIIADKLRVAEWDALVPNDYVFIVNNTIFISLADQTINSIEALQAYLTENPITVLYAPTEPTEIQLTPDEIAAYRQVLMSNPITTLYNSANATMKLNYGIDTKTYIDSRSGNSTATKDSVTLTAAKWVASSDSSYYTQAVTLSGITNNTKVDLDPTPEQLVSLINDGVSMCAINENGSITIYAFGDKPTSDMTISVIKSEVVYV